MAPRLWGIWTKSKLDMLEQYLDAFTTATKLKSPESLYIDAFAGQAENEDRLSGEKLVGSAEIALGVSEAAFTKLRFFETRENAKGLEDFLRGRFPDRDFAVVGGDSNVELPLELDRLADRGLRWMPTFAFVDPNATEARWSLLTSLAHFKKGKKFKVELFYLFSPQMFRRLLRTDAKLVREEDRETISEVFGTADWEQVYDAKVAGELSSSDATAEYLNLMRWRLETVLGYDWTHPIEVKNERGSPIYYMIFATDHPAGDAIMRSIFANAAADHPKMREEARRLRRALENEPASLFDARQLLALDAPLQEGERFYEYEPPTRPWYFGEDDDS